MNLKDIKILKSLIVRLIIAKFRKYYIHPLLGQNIKVRYGNKKRK
jgi:hypothetical protein